ncbi:hypothetical protein F383_09313 [Gossypium arboreum]|uniref:Uncharacterized protein n=1 Tax=Gossypium arboreum TaxID=29729 RepID=A0A0B0NAR5_GOSAR|nr:hypothetical protein F383_09313 [Gossypium arboreum]
MYLYHLVLTSFSAMSFLLPVEPFGKKIGYSRIIIDKYLSHGP